MDPEQTLQGPKREGPLFVVGIWRSGTSALYALLNQHPQIALLFEGDLRLLSSHFVTSQKPERLLARWNFWNEAARRHQIHREDLPLRISSTGEALNATYAAFAD